MGGKSLSYDAEVEYLGKDLRTASNRGAYIDTGIIADGNTKILVDYSESTRTRHNIWVYGARISTSSYRYGLLFHGSLGDAQGLNPFTNKLRRDYNTVNTSITLNSTDASASRFLFESTKGTLKVNGTEYSSVSTVTYNTGYSIYLFALNTAGAMTFDDIYSDAEFYIHKAQIYNDEQLVFDAIPVRKGNVGYLYDKVSGKLFGNAGTGEFILGQDKVLPYDELLSSLTIASGQTPAIITDYYPNQDTKFVFKCKLTERPTTAANKVIYGTFTYISNTLYRRVDCQFTNGLKITTKYGDGSSGLTNVVYAVDSVYELTIGNNYIIQDGTTTSYTTTGQFVTDYPLVLFSNCNNGTPSIVNTPASGFVGTLYGSFDIYEDTTLMRSYHPAKKNGRVGLYENVTNQMLFSPYGEFSE